MLELEVANDDPLDGLPGVVGDVQHVTDGVEHHGEHVGGEPGPGQEAGAPVALHRQLVSEGCQVPPEAGLGGHVRQEDRAAPGAHHDPVAEVDPDVRPELAEDRAHQLLVTSVRDEDVAQVARQGVHGKGDIVLGDLRELAGRQHLEDEVHHRFQDPEAVDALAVLREVGAADPFDHD